MVSTQYRRGANFAFAGICTLKRVGYFPSSLLSFIVLFYFVLLLIMHMFIVLILPAYKWLPPFAADV